MSYYYVLPDMVENLNQQLLEVHNILSEITQKQNDFYNNIYETLSMNAKLQTEIKALKKENYELRLKQYNQLAEGYSSSDSDTESDDETDSDVIYQSFSPVKKPASNQYKSSQTNTNDSRPKIQNRPRQQGRKNTVKNKVTLLGGSIIRNTGRLVPKCTVNQAASMVYSISGLTIDKAAEKSRTIFQDHNENDLAVLQVGTSDLESNNIEELKEKYDNLIHTTTHTAPKSKVIITAVPQWILPKKNHINEKVDSLNVHLREVCKKRSNLHFIDANPVAIQSNYKHDGYHFNYHGTSFFARCIGNYICNCLNFPLPQLITNM